MAHLMDQIIVIDVESTCWIENPPDGQRSEIIQIGVCPLDVTSLRRVEKRSIMVRPVRSEISEFCTNLTGLTAEMFGDAVSFGDALRILKTEYQCKERLWASWGDYDRRQFERECAETRMGYPFGPSHLNIKSLFSAAMGLERELGLDEAYAKLGLAMEGRHHRGDDDAWNIAGVLGMLLQRMRNGTKV